MATELLQDLNELLPLASGELDRRDDSYDFGTGPHDFGDGADENAEKLLFQDFPLVGVDFIPIVFSIIEILQ